MKRTAKALIIKDGKYLILKRKPGSYFFPNQWDLPGGKIKDGESPTEAVIRETLEETSLEIDIDQQVGEYDYTANDVEVNSKVFSVKNFAGNVEISKDHTEYAWATEEELKHFDIDPIIKLHFKI